MVWNNKSIVPDKAFEKKQDDLRLKWEKFDAACKKLNKENELKYLKEHPKPIFFLLKIAREEMMMLIKGDFKFKQTSVNSYDKFKAYTSNPYNIYEFNEEIPEPMPTRKIIGYRSRIVEGLKKKFVGHNNIIVNLADGITTIGIKYDDIEALNIILIHEYDEYEGLIEEVMKDNNGLVPILGTYPELKEDFEKIKNNK